MNKSQIMTWFLAGHEVRYQTSPVIERQSAPVRTGKPHFHLFLQTSVAVIGNRGARLRFAQSWDLRYVRLTFQNECFSIASILALHQCKVQTQSIFEWLCLEWNTNLLLNKYCAIYTNSFQFIECKSRVTEVKIPLIFSVG